MPPIPVLQQKALDPRDHVTAELMKNIQGNILKGHGRDHTANIFLQFYPAKIADIKKVLGKVAIDYATNCYQQLKEREIFKRHGIPGGLNAYLFFSKKGFDKLGIATGGLLSDVAFQNGMAGRPGINDPAQASWETGFRTEVDCMILLADDDEVRLSAVAKSIIEQITLDEIDPTKQVAKIQTIEYGRAIRNANGDGLEHNGYVDGVSQPLFLKDEIDEYNSFNRIPAPPASPNYLFDPIFSLGQVLVKDALVKDSADNANAYGSYFVFRKLEQNVRKFKIDEARMGHTIFPDNKDKAKREIYGAWLVGRFEDGTPVESQPEDGLYGSGIFNNFNYSSDPSGGKCPHFAHIRKTNGRNLPNTLPQNPTMARRGIPFGSRNVNTNTDPVFEQMPEGGVGLLFMSYQSSLVNQFEVVQKAANAPVTTGGKNIDPVIGQQPSSTNGGNGYQFPQEWGRTTVNPTSFSFSDHITMKGGEYFFAPSMAFLESLIP